MDILKMYKLEPELKAVVDTAKVAPDKDRAYRDAKSAAFSLVGFGAQREELRNSRAWERFERHLCGEMRY